METSRVLVVEDEQDIRDLIRMQLELQNYQVTAVENATEAISSLNREQFDIALIDRMLPDSSGIQLTKTIRKEDKLKGLPIIMVTAMSESENIIEGLDAGADDYITKPFDINILHARVRAQLRRRMQAPQETQVVEREGLNLDVQKCRVTVHGKEINLTHTELQILVALATQPGIVLRREVLLENIMGEGIHVTTRTIDTHIAGLRKKLESCASLIETIRGVGYRFKDDDKS
jgi:DNA-binding response OmpR family regulator